MSSLRKQNSIFYLRASFVTFLQLVKARVYVNWEQTIENFLDFVAADRTFLIGSPQLTRLQLPASPPRPLYSKKYHAHYTRTPRDRLRSWRSIPPVVCIVLKVPRSALKVLEDVDADVIGTPVLHCESSGHSFTCFFSQCLEIYQSPKFLG